MRGEISEEEFESKFPNRDVKAYKAIINELNTWEVDDGGVELEGINAHMSKLNSSNLNSADPNPIVIPLIHNRKYLGIAASITLLLGVLIYWQLFMQSLTIYETATGETKQITLPDGNSIVHLASNSSVRFDQQIWDDKREIELEGRAYFIVSVGKRFQVKFKKGKVNVLGTRFEINSRKEIVSIKCFEGSIEATNTATGTVNILKKDQKLISDNKGNWEPSVLNEQKPSWLDGTNSFNNVPLYHVIDILESTYGIEVTSNDTNLNQVYSGSFPNDNLKLSLELVFNPFGIPYELKKNKVVLSP